MASKFWHDLVGPIRESFARGWQERAWLTRFARYFLPLAFGLSLIAYWRGAPIRPSSEPPPLPYLVCFLLAAILAAWLTHRYYHPRPPNENRPQASDQLLPDLGGLASKHTPALLQLVIKVGIDIATEAEMASLTAHEAACFQCQIALPNIVPLIRRWSWLFFRHHAICRSTPFGCRPRWPSGGA
ncbi:hypothetical protein HY523_00425, partial [Candidatus Berkelbacteria bacterium]|nr:hypothetical protein [Candidatus Berkelbacteria bacterium]